MWILAITVVMAAGQSPQTMRQKFQTMEACEQARTEAVEKYSRDQPSARVEATCEKGGG